MKDRECIRDYMSSSSHYFGESINCTERLLFIETNLTYLNCVNKMFLPWIAYNTGDRVQSVYVLVKKHSMNLHKHIFCTQVHMDVHKHACPCVSPHICVF